MASEDLPEAAPAFAAHFTDPVYDDPAGEFAPFGSDEGFDMLYDWAERRDELDSTTTVAYLVEESGSPTSSPNLTAQRGRVYRHLVARSTRPRSPSVPASRSSA